MGYPLLAHMLELRAYPDEWASDYSDEIRVEAAKDEIAPLTPSDFTISSIAQGIELTWKNPTLNFDGTTCRDLAWIAVYRSTVAGIDPNNPTTYDERKLIQGESYIFNSADTSTTYYFVITAMDRTGNESDPTSELSAAPGEPISAPTKIPDDATGLIFDDSIGGDGVVSGYGILGIAFQDHATTWVNFDRYRLWYQYTDDGGTTWYDENGTAGAWTELKPLPRWGFMHKGLDSTGAKAYRYKATIVSTDGIESTTPDTAGGASTTADASDNSALVAITIFAMNIVALGEVRAENIKVTNLSAINADLGAVTAGSIVVGDSTNKLWLNDASDGGLAIGGTVKSSAPFRVTAAGALTAANATITGTVTIQGGSGIGNLSDAGALATLNVVGTAQIDNLAVTTAKIADAAITTAKIDNLAVTNAKINDLSADKINTGTLDASVVNVTNINASNINTGTLDASVVNVTNLNASNITTGNLSADHIYGGTLDFSAISRNGLSVLNSELNGGITSDKLSVSQLSAISADLGTVAAGSIISASYKTSSSYPYIALNDESYNDELRAVNSSGDTSFYLTSDGRMQVWGPAVLLDGLDVQNSMTYLESGLEVTNGATGILHYSNTSVFSGTAPTSWTDLDLSSYVGSRVALVLLRVRNDGSVSENIRTRQNGSGWTSNDAVDSYPQAFGTRVVNGGNGFVLAITDSSGIIEWDSDQANSTVLYLLAYVN